MMNAKSCGVGTQVLISFVLLIVMPIQALIDSLNKLGRYKPEEISYTYLNPFTMQKEIHQILRYVCLDKDILMVLSRRTTYLRADTFHL